MFAILCGGVCIKKFCLCQTLLHLMLFYFRSLVVHGFVLDEAGKKMSKSIGNVVDPNLVINGGKVKYILIDKLFM